jgi:DNA-binding NtrC family response regulator
MIRLLLHSRDLTLQSALAAGLGSDFSVAIDSNRERVRDLIERSRCDVVLLDFDGYPADEQFEALDELGSLAAPVIAVMNDEPRKTMELVRRGVQNYCQRPLVISEVAFLVRRACDCAALKKEMQACRAHVPMSRNCGDLVGSSPSSKRVYDLIRRVAGADAFVLITGESGTGKELIARAVHSLSNRHAQPFIAVSCGAIPESLIEAELFGSEKGAFTGASARRTGYFEEAGEGTLFLDEIGELSHHTQIKLLRVLQQREFMRLGSSATIPLRARILFATHRNLKQMVEAGSFREDLYYRVNVVGIHASPLRERREDIPQLAHHFLTSYARSYGKSITSIKPDALALLRAYEWPGNVRELENAIQSAIILSDGDSIAAAELPEAIHQQATGPDDVSTGINDNLRWNSFEDQLREYKIKLATEAVKECKGNKTLAAQSLNISRTYLHRLIREPGEDGPALRVA